jgi:calcineurin-like phosphoesterase family protein
MKLLNIKTGKEQNVFFSSDFHLNHQGPRGGTPLWQSRGYKSPEDMTEQIIAKVNELVMPNDYLFYMGDWCLNTTEDKFESDLVRFNCRNIIMLWGNHNSRVKDAYEKALQSELGRTDIEAYPVRYKNIVFCGDYLEVVVDGQYICMCHYPIDSFNKMRNGAIMLCGHCHYSYEDIRDTCPKNKRLDLSWDGHFKPLSINDIKTIMAKKELVAVDHHGKV